MLAEQLQIHVKVLVAYSPSHLRLVVSNDDRFYVSVLFQKAHDTARWQFSLKTILIGCSDNGTAANHAIDKGTTLRNVVNMGPVPCAIDIGYRVKLNNGLDLIEIDLCEF